MKEGVKYTNQGLFLVVDVTLNRTNKSEGFLFALLGSSHYLGVGWGGD